MGRGLLGILGGQYYQKQKKESTTMPYNCSRATHPSELAQWQPLDGERNRSWPSSNRTCDSFVWCAAHVRGLQLYKAGFVVIEKVTQGIWENELKIC